MASKIGATFGMSFALALAFLSFQIVSSGPVDKREASIEDSLEDFKNQILGGKCITDDNCSPISYCDRSDLQFECKLQWWFILAVALAGLFILSSIISCLCCPCCCLYNLGKSLCDCLCCCCPSSRGRYSRP